MFESEIRESVTERPEAGPRDRVRRLEARLERWVRRGRLCVGDVLLALRRAEWRLWRVLRHNRRVAVKRHILNDDGLREAVLERLGGEAGLACWEARARGLEGTERTLSGGEPTTKGQRPNPARTRPRVSFALPRLHGPEPRRIRLRPIGALGLVRTDLPGDEAWLRGIVFWPEELRAGCGGRSATLHADEPGEARTNLGPLTGPFDPCTRWVTSSLDTPALLSAGVTRLGHPAVPRPMLC